MNKNLKYFALLSYSLILLKGFMMGVPLILWLLFTSVEFGNPDQLFAVLGLIGLILSLTRFWHKNMIKVLAFILLIMPIARRIYDVGFESFLYLWFMLPASIFVIAYSSSAFSNKKTNT